MTAETTRCSAHKIAPCAIIGRNALSSLILSAAMGVALCGTSAASSVERIALPDRSHPEGVIFDDAGNLYVTSMGRGSVERVPPGGKASEPFIAPGSGGLMGAQGGRVDQARRLLYVCSSNNGANPDAPKNSSALKAFSLSTGELQGSWDLPGGTEAYCNDMVVLPSGAVLVSDSLNPVILVLNPGADRLETWLQSDLFKGEAYNLNNMALEPDGRTLYVGKLGTGELFRIRVAVDGKPEGVPVSIKLPRPIDDPDGIALLGPGKMLICEASVVGNKGRVTLVEIDGDTATLAPVLENISVPTGVALRDGHIYVAESQVDQLFVPERKGVGVKPYAVLRYPLPAGL